MQLRKYLLRFLPLLLLGFAATHEAVAAPLASGSFPNDDSFFSYSFTTASFGQFTFNTTSYATGGFAPVLTLFNSLTGREIDNAGTGTSDVSITDALGASSYILYLTEFPNVANGRLSDGFLFTGSPTITGDICGVTGGKFLDTTKAPCTQRTANYAVNLTTSPVPEPPTWLLVLPPVALLIGVSRRFTA